mmetsp:Transcript_16592/g.22285  ORF Transcript_16592/g.22285 Transcript_16592/m.22285 type:complete len:90 (-) Transcript_16592:279-548(-)
MGFGCFVILDRDENDAALEIYVSCLGNASLCYIKVLQWDEAASTCSKVLEMKGDNFKALYRRGLSRFRMGMLKEAKADLMKTHKLEWGK